MSKSGKIVAVTGATGHQGSAAVRHLLEDGFQVRGVSRSPESPSARELSALGAEMVRADLDDPSEVRRALEGVYGVFAVLTFAEEGPEGEVRQGKSLADAAKDAGVEHFLYSSVGGAERHTGIPHFESKWEIEWHIRDIGLPWSVVRPAFMMDNYNFAGNVRSIRSGELWSAMDPSKELQMIAAEDIGGFGAMMMSDRQKWLHKAVEIAGDSLTMPQVAQTFSAALGSDVQYMQETLDPAEARSTDGGKLLSWFNEAGYEADIPTLRTEYPRMMTLSDWIANGFWAGAQRVRTRV